MKKRGCRKEKESSSIIRQCPCPRKNRDDDFELDLEDLMVMEAIWLSIQQGGRHRDMVYHNASAEEQVPGDPSNPTAEPSSSSGPPARLAHAIAALPECQQTTAESPTAHTRNTSALNIPLRGRQFPSCIRQSATETQANDGPGLMQTMTGPIMPECFEEQMMLAMAVSLAEAGARMSTQQGSCTTVVD